MTLLRNLTGTTPVSGDVPNVEKVFSTYLYGGTATSNTIRNDVNLVGEPVGEIDKKIISSFSAYNYEGNATGQTIKNGIDLATDGGMTWCKMKANPSNSAGAQPHHINDTVRGNNSRLELPGTGASGGASGGVIGFNSDGFEIGYSGNINASKSSFIAWTFKKTARFFDVVSYTGDGVAGREIPHNLGVVPGMIIVKCTSHSSTNWVVYHRETDATAPENKFLKLQDNAGVGDYTYWNDTAPTSSVFTIGTHVDDISGSGKTYIAYLFAHDPLGAAGDGSDGMISCGSYTGAYPSDVTVNVGWEPQYLMIKNISQNSNWFIVDSARGTDTELKNILFTDHTGHENAASGSADVAISTSTGFTISSGLTGANVSGNTFVYMAIRKPQYDGTSGGMTWFKCRDNTNYHVLFDTERGTDKFLYSNVTNSQTTDSTQLSTFNADGFTIGFGTGTNGLTGTAPLNYASWTFRKAERFFDVVTWTGNGSGSDQVISHNLTTTTGMIIVKRTNGTSRWLVWHKSLPSNNKLWLDGTDAVLTGYGNGAVDVVDGSFKAAGNVTSNEQDINISGEEYVAYLFAHDPNGEDNDGMIACGSYTPTSSATVTVSLGWEPQFVLVKKSSAGSDWIMIDSTRGMAMDSWQSLAPNSSYLEESKGYESIRLNADGFDVVYNHSAIHAGVGTHIYMAIRAPMMVEPESGTEVFAVDNGGSGVSPAFDSNFPVDAALLRHINSSVHTSLSSRMTGTEELFTSNTAAGAPSNPIQYDFSEGWYDNNSRSADYHSWMFKRAKGFFDVVAYSGNGVAGRTVNHSLGVVPEMVWVKDRTSTYGWQVYHSALGYTSWLYLDTADQASTANSPGWANFTSSGIDVGSYVAVNGGSDDYIAYLFATLDGVSKVGSYTGTGAVLDIDCGFSGGARFILIKPTSISSSWFFFDSVRGIVSGNDPYLYLNQTNAQVTSRDGVDPLPSGFTLTTDATWNDNGVEYIFLAIA